MLESPQVAKMETEKFQAFDEGKKQKVEEEVEKLKKSYSNKQTKFEKLHQYADWEVVKKDTPVDPETNEPKNVIYLKQIYYEKDLWVI